MTYVQDLEGSRRGVLKIFGVSWRRLEALCCFANDLRASGRRLGGVLETSCRHLGRVLEEFWGRRGAAGKVFLGTSRDIVFMANCNRFSAVWSTSLERFLQRA